MRAVAVPLRKLGSCPEFRDFKDMLSLSVSNFKQNCKLKQHKIKEILCLSTSYGPVSVEDSLKQPLDQCFTDCGLY